MKKFRNILLSLIILAMTLSVQSCLNLDEEIFSDVSALNFGQNESEINAIIAPIYSTLISYTYNFVAASECSGDMAIVPTRKGGDWFDGGAYRDLHMHTWTSQTSTLRSIWNTASQSVSTCNLIYETINASDLLSPEKKASTLAEIRGVRAFWLYVLMDNFGNVPLSVDFKDLSLPTTKPRQEVFNYIISELNGIKDILPDAENATYGKFTKGVAQVMLAKMYLNADAWGVESGVSDNWQAVIDACDAILAMNYSLVSDWKSQFLISNNGNSEAILPMCLNATNGGSAASLITHSMHYKEYLSLGHTRGGNNGICCAQDYAFLFNENDKRLAGSFITGERIDLTTGEVIMTAHDRPLIHTAEVRQIPGSQYAGSTWGQTEQEDGWRVYKWEIPTTWVGRLEADIAIFRLADVYLMKAEALVRKGVQNDVATDLVNAIRSRGFGNDSYNYTSVTLDEIALERKLEFAWEIFSRQDCIRFGTFQDARYLKLSTAGQNYKNIFPIPQRILDANPNLQQNPGY